MSEAVWFGKDAERLNLVGHAQQSDFEQIYDGFIPGTDERIRFEKPRSDHKENCLYDLVFSSKKSVSMQIHLGKDERLYKAHQETVLEIAQLIEKDYAQAKRQVNGERHVVKTEGIIAVLMPHHTTREQDMGVHTHLLIANGTYRDDGVWRSLRDVGLSHAYYLGDYFSARLAARVQELGFEIRETVTEQGHPSWELAGYTDEQIKVFSKRSENVEVKELVAAGYSRDDALLVTRKAKDIDETIEQMQERWGTEAQAHGIDAVVPHKYPVTPKRRSSAQDVLESAIRHYSHTSVHFSRDQIREYAFKLNRPFDVAQLDQAIADHPELIDYAKFGKLEDFQGHFTTAKALEREIRTVKVWMEGQGKATPVMDHETSAQALEEIRVQNGGYELKSGQRGAVIGVLASVNMHQCVHGLSGVGKTSALQQLKVLLDRQGVGVIGLAPSIPAAQTLGEELGIETQTVQKFIRNDIELQPGQFIVIDESGMDSAEMLDIVMQKANAVGARVLLVGDTGQNQAIEAGSPMRSVMAHGAEVHHIDEIIRQQDDIQRQAVELIAKGHGLDALSLLSEHDYVNEIEDRGQRVGEIADEFVSLPIAEQKQTLIVTGTNAEKDAISEAVRTRQKAQGILGEPVKVTSLEGEKLTLATAKQIETYEVGQELTLKRKLEKTATTTPDVYRVMAVKDNELVLLRTATDTLYRFNPQHQKFVSSVKVTQLRDRALSPEETREVQFYRKGDYVSLSRNYKTTGLHKDTPYRVMEKDGAELVVASAGGRLYRFNPKHYRDKKVFSAHEFNIAVGDSLRWTSTNREKGQINGSTVEIAALNGPVATAFTSRGQRLEIDLRQPLPVDYALCSTSYRIQGSDRANVFASATNDPTSNREPFYVSISRQIKKLKVWTDSYEGLKRRVAESNVQRNPIELLFGDPYGSSPVSANHATAQATAEPEPSAIEPDAGATGAEPPDADTVQQLHEHHPNHYPRRDGLISDGVRGATGEPEAVGDIRRDSGTDRDIEGVEGPTDELGADAWRDVVSGELRSGGDPQLHDEVAQQRLDASAAKLKSCMERVISSLTVLGNDESVYDSGIVKVTREVVEALEPIVSSLEGQPVAVPPKRDLTSAMARVINGLTAMDSEDVFGESEIIAEIKSLVERVEAHTIAQEQLTQHINPGDHHVRQNSSRESHRVSRDPGRVRNATAERTGADLQPSARADGQDRQLAGVDRESSQKADDTKRGQERYLPDGGESREPGRAQLPNATQPTELTRSDGSEARPADRLQRIADTLVRVRLQRELAEPMARLRNLLEASAQLERSNQEKQASISAKLNQYLNQAKVEVLDTTLTEWRSLRQEPELHQMPELAVAPSDRAELTSLLANYPAQKVIDYAMAEYAQVRQHFELDAIGDAKHQAPASATNMPTPRTNSPPKPKQSTAAPGRAASPPKPKPRNQRNPTPRPEKRVPVVAFWQPDYETVERPSYIDEKHWKEWVESRVHPEIILSRLQSIESQQVIERLLDKKLEFIGNFEKVGQDWKRRKLGSQTANAEMRYQLSNYQSLAEGGGWWVNSGVDPRYFPDLKPGEVPQRSTHGTFKPDMPRVDEKKTREKQAKDPNAPVQYRKYENPAGTKQELFEGDLSFADVPDGLADKIFEKYGVVRTEEERRLGVWYTIWKHPEIPIYRVEGDKKDAALTSQGRFVVSGQGVNAGYRAKDQNDDKLPERVLHPQLAVFAVPGRAFRYAFDADDNRNAILNVRREMVREAELVEARGSSAYTLTWRPEQGKGVDDLIQRSGALALEKADLEARRIASVARIHYRTEYNKLARQVRKENPNISAEHLDIKVYLRAIAKGEPKDGERFLSQSDHARSLKDPAQVTAYIKHIKASIPQYLQQQQAQEQERKDRARYEELAQSITAEMGALKSGPLDIEICLRLTLTHPDLERILSQGDWAKSRETPEEKHQYIQLVQTAALLTLQQRVAAQDRSEYESWVAQIPASPAQLSLEAVDMQVLLMAEQAGNPGDGDRLIAQSDHARTLSNPQEVQAYVERIKAEAPLWLEQSVESARAAVHRETYKALSQEITQTLGDLPDEQRDTEVYLLATARGLESASILAQSDQALQLHSPDEVENYVERLQGLGLEQVQRQAEAEAQHKLNVRAMGSSSHLLSFLAQKDASGWRRFTIAEYTLSGTEGYFSVDHTERGNILRVVNDQLTANVTTEDVRKFEKAIENIIETQRLNRRPPERSGGFGIGE